MNKRISTIITISLTTILLLSACSKTLNIDNEANLKDMLTGPIPQNTVDMPKNIYDMYISDLDVVRKNIKDKRDEYNSYLLLGAIYKNFGDNEKAYSAYDYAANLTDSGSGAWLNKASTLEDMEKYKEAAESYQYVLDNIGAVPQAYFRLGVINQQHMNKSKKEIIKFYEKSLVETVFAPVIVDQYIKYLYYDAKDEAAALKVLDEAIAKNPTNQDLKDMKKNGFKASL